MEKKKIAVPVGDGKEMVIELDDKDNIISASVGGLQAKSGEGGQICIWNPFTGMYKCYPPNPPCNRP